ncbi:MAG: potassium transporter TrkA, partial [Sulfurimonas sp.]|nr:potassium transporter TrkA [Sulfurimonas sp.]
YMYIDMNLINHSVIEEFVRRSIFIHKKFNHDLIIKIVNPSNIDILQEIKKFRSDNVIIDIEYDCDDLKSKFLNDMKFYHVGLVIVSKDIFADYNMRTTLYESHVPIFKVADKSFSKVKDVVLILSDNRDLEKISSNIFDISEQMGFNIELYNYLNEHQQDKEQVVEHYYNLSTIFSKSIKVFKENENPIRTLKQKDTFVQVLPFTNKLTQRRIFSMFSTDNERLYYRLDDYHQIFIPVQL